MTVIIDFDAARKRRARDRRLVQKAKRLRTWQGARDTQWETVRRVAHREKAYATLRSFFGSYQPKPIMLFNPHRDGGAWRGFDMWLVERGYVPGLKAVPVAA
jgi:hypothetical protein